MSLKSRIKKAIHHVTDNRAVQAVATGGYSEVYRGTKKAYEDLSGITEAKKAEDDAENAAAIQSAQLAADQQNADSTQLAEIEAARKRRASMRGRMSTILTSALGASGLSASRKTLLGG